MSKINEVKKFLQQMVELRAGASRLLEARYICQEDFVLQHGRSMEVTKSPFQRGEMKMCFMNAQKLMTKEGYTYCEGYAFRQVLPVLHAWLIDSEGNVVDPTWEDSEECVYFGVPFKTEYVLSRQAETKTYLSVIDDYQGHWPLLTGGAEAEKVIEFA